MNGIATITQRGQVVIPQPIRQFFNLKPSDRLFFGIEDDKIVARPIISVDEMFGTIKSKRVISKEEYKKVITKRVIKKFKKQ